MIGLSAGHLRLADFELLDFVLALDQQRCQGLDVFGQSVFASLVAQKELGSLVNSLESVPVRKLKELIPKLNILVVLAFVERQLKLQRLENVPA